jgi:hypothetical protein
VAGSRQEPASLLCNLQYSSGVIFPATAALLLWHCSAAPECPQAARCWVAIRRDGSEMKTTTTKPQRTSGRPGKKTTAQNIELYSSAYRTAWDRISALQKRDEPNLALRLHSSIRRQLKEGAKNPFLIAGKALDDLQTDTVVTPKRDARTRRKPNPRIS